MSLLDFLFPKHCIQCKIFGSYLCPKCFSYVTFAETGFCVVCQRAAVGGLTHPLCKRSLTIDGVFSSLVYKGVVKKLVYQFKYQPYLTSLKPLLIDFFYEGLIQKETCYRLLQSQTVFVPIPLHVSKFRKRGYNQSQLLAQGLGQKLDIPVLDMLERIKETKTQVGLLQKERSENIKGAFGLRKPYAEKVKDLSTVFLVDDVVTSGATLKEAAKALKKAGIEQVFGITLAHGQ
jgi:competence protein ComFC